MTSPLSIYVLDTSAVISMKRLPVGEQWPVMSLLLDRVRGGRVVFPRQVTNEVTNGQHPDAPGAWIATAAQAVHQPEPTSASLREVLAVAPQLVELDGDEDVADPYVAAMALEVASQLNRTPVVVTLDVVDRLPLKESLRTACGRLGIQVCEPAEMIAWSKTDDASRLAADVQEALDLA